MADNGIVKDERVLADRIFKAVDEVFDPQMSTFVKPLGAAIAGQLE